MRTGTIAAGVLAGIALALPAGASAGARAPDRDSWERTAYGLPAAPPAYARGFNSRQLADWATGKTGPDVDTALAEMKRTRSLVHRLTVYWWDVQPVQGVWNENDWWRYDRVVNTAHKEGFRLILNPMGSPNWARQANRRVPEDSTGIFRKNSHPDAEYWDDWDTFIRTLTQRYGAKTYAYEIWNEENSRPFWDVDPDPADPSYEARNPNPATFKSLFCRAAEQIRGERPGALVGIGGLTARRTTWISPAGTNRVREMRSSTFLNRAYAAGIAGCNPSFVGYHPYVYKSYCGANPTMANTPAFRELVSVRDVMVNRRQGAKKIWMTEWSFPSRPFRSGNSTCSYTPSKQASLIAREHNYIRTRPNVRFSIYFNYRDAPESSLTNFNNSVGMAQVNWRRKQPTWNTWRGLAQTPAP